MKEMFQEANMQRGGGIIINIKINLPLHKFPSLPCLVMIISMQQACHGRKGTYLEKAVNCTKTSGSIITGDLVVRAMATEQLSQQWLHCKMDGMVVAVVAEICMINEVCCHHFF